MYFVPFGGEAVIIENRMHRAEIICLMLAVAASAVAQPTPVTRRSPKAVVEQFWKMETQGGRLTDEGWRAADSYFLKPIAPPREKVIYVIDNDFAIWDPKITDSKAEETIGVGGLMWKIDPRAHISVASNQLKGFVGYTLVLSDKHWQFAPDHSAVNEVSGAPEWRIEKEGNYVFLTLNTAIRYLSEIHDNTTDRVIKENAETKYCCFARPRGRQACCEVSLLAVRMTA